MFGFQQCFPAGALSAEFDLAEPSGAVTTADGRIGEEVVILVPDHSRLVRVSTAWAGGIFATDLLWDRFLKEGLYVRRCLVPVSGFYCRGKRSEVLVGLPYSALPLVLAGVLAWSAALEREVCVVAAAHAIDDPPGVTPLPVAPAFWLRWCHSDARKDLIDLMEGSPWRQPIRFQTWMIDKNWSAEVHSPHFAAYPPERDLHYLPSPPMSGRS